MQTDRDSAITEAERLISHALEAHRNGAVNISSTEVDRKAYQARLAQLPWQNFIQSADYSYFAARTMLSAGVHLYGLFCAHQCVENYLKAHIKCHANETPQSHRLRDLLEQARLACGNDSFLASEYAEAICLKYEPFYEIARYPAQISRPRNGMYAWLSGVDEQILDYFVYQMRRELPLPDNSWDILSPRGHMDLQLVQEHHPDLYRRFTDGNLNFLPAGTAA
jgi:HEPN domain-containing protein